MMDDETVSSTSTTGSTRRRTLAAAALAATIPPFGRTASAQSVIKIGGSLPKQGPQTEHGMIDEEKAIGVISGGTAPPP